MELLFPFFAIAIMFSLNDINKTLNRIYEQNKKQESLRNRSPKGPDKEAQE